MSDYEDMMPAENICPFSLSMDKKYFKSNKRQSTIINNINKTMSVNSISDERKLKSI